MISLYAINLVIHIKKSDITSYKNFHKKRIKHLVKILSKLIKKNDRIGIIGYSIFDKYLKNSFPEAIFYNIVPKRMGSEVKKYMSDASIIYFDIENTNHESRMPKKLDIIIFTEVLEHLFSDDHNIMKNIYKITKKDGYLIFSVPNISALVKLATLIIGHNPYMTKKQQIEGVFGGYGHIREYSLGEAIGLCASAGFSVKIQIGMNDYGSIFDKVAKFLPKRYAETILIVAQK